MRRTSAEEGDGSAGRFAPGLLRKREPVRSKPVCRTREEGGGSGGAFSLARRYFATRFRPAFFAR
jgi:hypothetical protein